eukprot:758663-Pleurochrysis_carterae.AAC.2
MARMGCVLTTSSAENQWVAIYGGHVEITSLALQEYLRLRSSTALTDMSRAPRFPTYHNIKRAGTSSRDMNMHEACMQTVTPVPVLAEI